MNTATKASAIELSEQVQAHLIVYRDGTAKILTRAQPMVVVDAARQRVLDTVPTADVARVWCMGEWCQHCPTFTTVPFTHNPDREYVAANQAVNDWWRHHRGPVGLTAEPYDDYRLPPSTFEGMHVPEQEPEPPTY